jgi:hypothetical protein
VVTSHLFDEGILAGLVIEEDPRNQELEDEETALAVRVVRWAHNKHDCTRKAPDDPPCQHQDHFKDVAQMRVALQALNLPGDVILLRWLEGRETES